MHQVFGATSPRIHYTAIDFWVIKLSYLQTKSTKWVNYKHIKLVLIYAKKMINKTLEYLLFQCIVDVLYPLMHGDNIYFSYQDCYAVTGLIHQF